MFFGGYGEGYPPCVGRWAGVSNCPKTSIFTPNKESGTLIAGDEECS